VPDPINYTRRLRMMLTALAALTGGALLFNFLINPFGTWRHRLVNGIYYRVRAGHERVIAPYLLRSTEPSTVMFGTSRVLMGIPIEQGIKDGVLNAGMAAARPEEIAQGVALALENPHLKRVIWGADFFTFDQRFKPNPDTTARLGGDEFAVLVEDAGGPSAAARIASLASREFRRRTMSGTEWLSAAASPRSAQVCACASAAWTASGALLLMAVASATPAAFASASGQTCATTFMRSASVAPNSAPVSE